MGFGCLQKSWPRRGLHWEGPDVVGRLGKSWPRRGLHWEGADGVGRLQKSWPRRVYIRRGWMRLGV